MNRNEPLCFSVLRRKDGAAVLVAVVLAYALIEPLTATATIISDTLYYMEFPELSKDLLFTWLQAGMVLVLLELTLAFFVWGRAKARKSLTK